MLASCVVFYVCRIFISSQTPICKTIPKGRITKSVRYKGIHYLGILNSMEEWSELSESPVISLVSAVEECPLSGVTAFI